MDASHVAAYARPDISFDPRWIGDPPDHHWAALHVSLLRCDSQCVRVFVTARYRKPLVQLAHRLSLILLGII